MHPGYRASVGLHLATFSASSSFILLPRVRIGSFAATDFRCLADGRHVAVVEGLDTLLLPVLVLRTAGLCKGNNLQSAEGQKMVGKRIFSVVKLMLRLNGPNRQLKLISSPLVQRRKDPLQLENGQRKLRSSRPIAASWNALGEQPK
jgi:hypothetical protein